MAQRPLSDLGLPLPSLRCPSDSSSHRKVKLTGFGRPAFSHAASIDIVVAGGSNPGATGTPPLLRELRAASLGEASL